MNEFLPQAKIVQKDLFELDFKDLIDFNIIIDAFGEWEKLSLYKKHIECLSKFCKEARLNYLLYGVLEVCIWMKIILQDLWIYLIFLKSIWI